MSFFTVFKVSEVFNRIYTLALIISKLYCVLKSFHRITWVGAIDYLTSSTNYLCLTKNQWFICFCVHFDTFQKWNNYFSGLSGGRSLLSDVSLIISLFIVHMFIFVGDFTFFHYCWHSVHCIRAYKIISPLEHVRRYEKTWSYIYHLPSSQPISSASEDNHWSTQDWSLCKQYWYR